MAYSDPLTVTGHFDEVVIEYLSEYIRQRVLNGKVVVYDRCSFSTAVA